MSKQKTVSLRVLRQNQTTFCCCAVLLYGIYGTNRAVDIGTVIKQLRNALEPTNTEIMVLLTLKLQRSRREEAENLIKEALGLSPGGLH